MVNAMMKELKEIVSAANDIRTRSESVKVIRQALQNINGLGQKRKRKQPANPSSYDKTNSERVVHYLSKGENNKAFNALNAAVNSNPTQEEIMKKYPLLVDQCHVDDELSAQCGKIPAAKYCDFVYSRKSLSATGVDGTSLEIIKYIVDTHGGAELLSDAHLALMNFGADLVGTDEWRDFTALKCHILGKKEGGFRTLGIANALNRLFQGVSSSYTIRDAKAGLHDLNLTLEPSGTTKNVVLAQRAVDLKLHIINKDITNAFNNNKALDAAKLWKEKKAEYLCSAIYLFNGTHAVHIDGMAPFLADHIPQGSSFGSTCMAIIMDQILQHTRSLEGVLATSLADDATIIAKTDEVLKQANEVFEKDCAKYGNVVNKAKDASLRPLDVHAVKIMGAPVGEKEAVKRMLEEKIAKYRRQLDEFIETIRDLRCQDAPVKQTAFRTLVANHLSKFVYVQQTQPVDISRPLLKEVDEHILQVCGAIFGFSNVELSSIEDQIRLPTNKGGFGVTNLTDTAIFQRFGALVRSLEFVTDSLVSIGSFEAEQLTLPELETLMVEIEKGFNFGENCHIKSQFELLRSINARKAEFPKGKEAMGALYSLQNKLTDKYHEQNFERWKDAVEADNLLLQEICTSISAPETGRPLNIPTIRRENQIDDQAFLLYARRRLRLPIFPSIQSIDCKQCGGSVDVDGEHAFKCTHIGKGAMHMPIVNAVHQSLKEAAKLQGVSIVKEPLIKNYVKEIEKSNFTGDHLINRRADVAIGDSVLKELKLIDVTHKCLECPDSVMDIGRTVEIGELRKDEFYQKICVFPQGVSLIPFSIDSYGRWGQRFKAFIKTEFASATCGKLDIRAYNRMISRARSIIQVAHVRAAGVALKKCLDESIREEYKFSLWCKEPQC